MTKVKDDGGLLPGWWKSERLCKKRLFPHTNSCNRINAKHDLSLSLRITSLLWFVDLDELTQLILFIQGKSSETFIQNTSLHFTLHIYIIFSSLISPIIFIYIFFFFHLWSRKKERYFPCINDLSIHEKNKEKINTKTVRFCRSQSIQAKRNETHLRSK